MGVGAMIVGGLSSMWKIRRGVVRAVRQLFSGIGRVAGAVARVDEEMPKSHVGTLLALAAIGTFAVYRMVTGSLSMCLNNVGSFRVCGYVSLHEGCVASFPVLYCCYRCMQYMLSILQVMIAVV